MHDGNIGVESEVDKGSIFWFELSSPEVDNLTKITPAKVSVEPLGQSKATLMVEGVVSSGVYPIKIKILNENGQEIGSKTIMVEVDKTDVVTTILYSLLVIIFVLIIAVIVALIFKGKGRKEGSNGGEKMIIQEKGPNVKVEEEELY